MHSGLEKHCFHHAEEPHSPDWRKGDQTFVFVCVSIKERSWLRFIKHTDSKLNTFSCKDYFFQIVLLLLLLLNARLWSTLVLRLCAIGSDRALIYDELYIELNDVKGQTFAR